MSHPTPAALTGTRASLGCEAGRRFGVRRMYFRVPAVDRVARRKFLSSAVIHLAVEDSVWDVRRAVAVLVVAAIAEAIPAVRVLVDGGGALCQAVSLVRHQALRRVATAAEADAVAAVRLVLHLVRVPRLSPPFPDDRPGRRVRRRRRRIGGRRVRRRRRRRLRRRRRRGRRRRRRRWRQRKSPRYFICISFIRRIVGNILKVIFISNLICCKARSH